MESNNEYKNSNEKGDLLENKAADILKKLLESGDFYQPGKLSKLYQKKKYYSEIRKADIVFDIAIETTLPGAPTYSMLTLIECKNYGRPISVDKIEAFESKVRSIGEHNTRAMFISNSALQKSAFETALSKKIAVIRLFSDKQFEWINYRKKRDFNVNLDSAEPMFTEGNYKSSNFVGIQNQKVFDNIPDLLIESGIMDYYIHKEKFINIPYIKDERFEEIVDRLNNYDIRSGLSLNTEKLCAFLNNKYPVSFNFDSVLPSGLLGKITFDPLEIFVTASLKADIPKWRYTLLHEISHLILHSKLLEGIEMKVDTSDSIFSSSNGREQTARIEYQANTLASRILIPKNSLLFIVANYFIKQNIHKGYLFLDEQPVNQSLANTLIYKISEDFGVSYSVAKFRLKALNLIKDTVDYSLRGKFRKS